MLKHTYLLATVALATLAGGAAQAEAIKIGFAAPLSGPQAYFGTTWLNGVKLYADRINANGGIDGNMIEIVSADDKADPREGTVIAQRFCDDDEIKAVIGHMNSGITIPTMDIYSACDLAQVTISSSPDVTALDYPNIVQPVPNDFAQGKLSANFAYGVVGARKAATVDDKQAFGQAVAELFQKDFTADGGEVVASVSVDARDVDFSSVITSLKQSNPDVIYFGGVMPQLALFVKQMRSQGITAAFLTPDGAYTPDFMKLAGTAGTGSYVTFQAPPYDSAPDLSAFAKDYHAKYGEEPGPQSAMGWMELQIIEAAIKKSPEIDRAEIVKAARATDMDTLMGPIKLNAAGGIDAGGLFMYKAGPDGFEMVGKDE